jgi:hypothetical protein
MSGSGLEEGLAADVFAAEVDALTVEQIRARTRMELENGRHARADLGRIQDDVAETKQRIKENDEKIKVNRQLPYLVSSVVEVRVGRRHGVGARPPPHPHPSSVALRLPPV